MRVFGLLLFVYGGPGHLVFETHWDHAPASLCGTPAKPAALSAESDEDDSDHTPHQASDHSLRLAGRVKACQGAFDACVVAASEQVVRSIFQPLLFLIERQNPPGSQPPGPLQPRAPPLA